MKILVISDAWLPQVNGVVRTYEFLNAELEKRGHETHVIGPANFPRRIPMPGYSEIELAIMPYRRLCKMIDFHDPDHIHIATEGPLGVAARKYCLRRAYPFTTSYHTHFPDYAAKRAAKFLPFLYEPVRKMAIARIRKFHEPANAMFVATPSLEQELHSWGLKPPMRRLIRGVTDIFRPEGERVMDDIPRPIALFVGRVAIEKNIEAFLDMNWDGSKVVIGDGPSLDHLREKYPDTHFVGKKVRDELAAHYRSADLFVFPSKTDTFGIVLVEAMASGLPIAAYNVTGPHDIITEPFLGVLHDDLSIAAKQALRTTGTPKERHEHARSHYSWPTVAKQFLHGIKDAIITKRSEE